MRKKIIVAVVIIIIIIVAVFWVVNKPKTETVVETKIETVIDTVAVDTLKAEVIAIDSAEVKDTIE